MLFSCADVNWGIGNYLLSTGVIVGLEMCWNSECNNPDPREAKKSLGSVCTLASLGQNGMVLVLGRLSHTICTSSDLSSNGILLYKACRVFLFISCIMSNKLSIDSISGVIRQRKIM